MKKILLAVIALAATSTAWGQYTSTCTTSQTISLLNQRFQPVYLVTLTNGNTCSLNFVLPTDINLSQTIVLKMIQSSTAPYSGAISAGNTIWPSGVASVPQSAGAIAFAKCEVDPTGAYCYPLGYSGGNLTAPQVTVLSSGSGTYTTPTGTIFLDVEMVGGGGGGAGTGPVINPGTPYGVIVSPWSSSTSYPASSYSIVTYNGSYYIACSPSQNVPPNTSAVDWLQFAVAGDGTNGTASSFGSLTAGAGSAGTYFSNLAGSGGSSSGGDIDSSGAPGSAATSVNGQPLTSGNGGAAQFGLEAFGSGGAGATQGMSNLACANGATFPGFTFVATQGGNGGGAGGYLRKIIAAPAASYAYAVGGGGSGGAAGQSGNAGTAGAGGVIIVSAYQ